MGAAAKGPQEDGRQGSALATLPSPLPPRLSEPGAAGHELAPIYLCTKLPGGRGAAQPLEGQYPQNPRRVPGTHLLLQPLPRSGVTPIPTQGTPGYSCTLCPGLSPLAEGHMLACVWGRMMCFKSSCSPIPGERREFSPGSRPSRCTDQGRVREGLLGRRPFPPGKPVRHSRVGGGTSTVPEESPIPTPHPWGAGEHRKNNRRTLSNRIPAPCPSPQPAVTTKAAAARRLALTERSLDPQLPPMLSLDCTRCLCPHAARTA